MPQADPTQLTIITATDAHTISQAYAIRRAVFIEEQGVPEEMERDADDSSAVHVLAVEDGKPVGCGRMVAKHGHVKIGRMAVMRGRREKGIGARIMRHLVEEVRARGYRRAELHAQLTAEGFYLKQGFRPVGPVFEEAGIGHRRMELELES